MPDIEHVDNVQQHKMLTVPPIAIACAHLRQVLISVVQQVTSSADPSSKMLVISLKVAPGFIRQ